MAFRRRTPSLKRNGSSSSSGPFEVSVALVGEQGSGKSALAVKYLTRRFISEYDPNLEDTYCRHDTVDHQDVVVWVMDTCDKDGKDSSRYLKWADGYVVVYSITSKHSFRSAEKYLEMIHNHRQRVPAQCDTPMILVGSQLDLERYRQVSRAEGLNMAAKYDCNFQEASSAEEFVLVERVFHELVREILQEQARHMPVRALFATSEKEKALRQPRSPAFPMVRKSQPPMAPKAERRDRDGSSSSGSQTPPQAGGRFSFLKGKGLRGIFHSAST